MAEYHVHHVLILTRDDPEGESIGETLRDHCRTLGAANSNIETWEFQCLGENTSVKVDVDPAELEYDTFLGGLI